MNAFAFSITGEAMTRAARDLLLSEDPGKAFRLISEGLCGDQASEVALLVLKGTHVLTGDSNTGISLSESKDEKYCKDLKFIYAGRFRYKGFWIRPTAIIRSYYHQDGIWATKQVGDCGLNGSQQREAWSKCRAEYYCSSNEKIFSLEHNKEKVWVAFEPCSEVPHWMEPSKTPQEAFEETLKVGRSLEERPNQIEIENMIEESKERKVYTKTNFKESADQLEQRAQEEEEKLQKEIQFIKEKVLQQAGNDTFDLKLKDESIITIPRAPFVRWAIKRTAIKRDLMPEWKNVSRSGMKMINDDPDHTDWVVGAGIPLDEAYDNVKYNPIWEKMIEIQDECRSPKVPFQGIRAAMEMLSKTIHSAGVIVDAGVIEGIVGENIAVFPDSNAERANQLDGKVGIVVERGGKLAHFAVVTKGKGITVMCHADACDLFENGTRLSLNPKTGKIVILDD